MAENALALVVRGTDWSETSRITTLFTREFGKVRALAKGGRRLNSKFEIAFDLLTVCRVTYLRKAHGGLDLLIEAQVAERFPHLRTDLHALNVGYYVAELLADGTQDYDPHPELFDAAKSRTWFPPLSLFGSSNSAIARDSMRVPCAPASYPCHRRPPFGSFSAPKRVGWCARTARPASATADRFPNRPGPRSSRWPGRRTAATRHHPPRRTSGGRCGRSSARRSATCSVAARGCSPTWTVGERLWHTARIVAIRPAGPFVGTGRQAAGGAVR